MLTLEQMTPEQKIGRVLCARRFFEKDDIDFTMELVKNQACGALQMPFRDWSADLIKKFREAADYPLLVINDMERGFPLSNIRRTPLLTFAAANNKDYIRAFAAHTASEARKVGYSGCWGPVVDIMRVDAPCAVARRAGDTPEGVISITEELFRTYASYNFQATGKHYPGGHDSGMDTHMVGAISSVTEEELISFDLVPYLHFMKEGILPCIMVDHSVYKNIDPDHPASLSKKVIGIIRRLGFDGVIYTDSLAMMGILQTFGEKQAHAMALMAGNDIVLSNYRTPTREIYNMMLESYREGFITDERLDEAVRRIMRLEEYCAKTPENPVPPPCDINEIMECVARDSITAECAPGVPTALDDPEKKRLFIVETMQDYDDDVPVAEIEPGSFYDPHLVKEGIARNFPNADIMFIPEFPKAKDNETVLTAATNYDDVVFVSYCTSSCYLGTDSLTRRIEVLIDCLSIPGKLKALVHFGNPLALKNLRPVERKLLGYNSEAAIPYAFDVLAGKIPARGVNPYSRLTEKYRSQKLHE